MQIILLEKIGGLGNLGDVVTVKNGYARNFLIPQSKAKRATEINLKEFETRRAELEAKQAAILANAQALQAKLEGQTASVAQKAGVDGRLFGSVTNHDIAEELNKQGFKIHKSQIRMPNGHLKTVGDSQVTISLHADVAVEVTVAIYGETA